MITKDKAQELVQNWGEQTKENETLIMLKLIDEKLRKMNQTLDIMFDDLAVFGKKTI